MTSVYDLVKQANTGDEAAIVELIERYMWMIDACRKRNGEIDEDCKQTILAQVVRAIRQFPV